MAKIAALFIFGFTLIVVGGTWMLYNEAVQWTIDRFWVASAMLDLQYIGWRVIPTIIFIVGIVSLVIAGAVTVKGSRVATEQ